MFTSDIYLQVFENRVRARNLSDARTIEITSERPFSHPRGLIGNFAEAENVIKAAVSGVSGKGLFRSSRILIQAMENCEGGLTQVESRVLKELALSAGAVKVVVGSGAPLSDEAINRQLSVAR